MTTSEPTSKNIIVGAAAFYISDGGADLPALTAGASVTTVTGTDYRNVGFTSGGVTVSYEPTYGDVTVDQLLDSALVFKSGMKVTVNTTFGEATLENLLVTWGQASTTYVPGATNADDTLTIEGGALGDYPTERSLLFVGNGPRSKAAKSERVYHVNRAIQTQTTAHDLKRDAATNLPVSFRCLPGANFSGASATAYGKVLDRALS